VFVVDLNTLIDLIEADKSVIRLVGNHLGPIYIPSVVLNQIEKASQVGVRRLGVRKAECTIEHLFDARQPRTGLSFRDRLCLIIARMGNWVLITNDPVLRTACAADQIRSLCALDIVIELVRLLHLPCRKAIRVVRNLHSVNSHHVSKESVTQCERRVETLCRKRRQRR
jgi:rRNA-processing protein FCF1